MSLQGKSIVTTCLTFEQEARVAELAERCLASVKSAVSGKTDCLVISDTDFRYTNKYRRAQELIRDGQDIRIIGYAEFCALAEKEAADVRDEDRAAAASARVKKPAKEARFNIERGILISCEGGGEEIVTPEGVRVIGQNAFAMKRMKRVVISEGVREIRKDAFLNCRQLVEVVLPHTLQKIGQHAFSGCRSLEKIDLPDGLKEIGASAFCENFVIKNVHVPDGVEIIRKNTFRDCGATREYGPIRELVLPASLKKIEEEAFVCFADKLIFNGDDPQIERYAFRRPIGELVVGKGIKTIPGFTFTECGAIRKIEFRSRETKIGSSAFAPEAFPALAEAVFPAQLNGDTRRQIAPFAADLIENGKAPSEEYAELWKKAIRGQKKTLESMILEYESLRELMLREKLVSVACARELIEKTDDSRLRDIKLRLMDYLGDIGMPDIEDELDLDKGLSLQEARKLFVITTKGEEAEITGYKGTDTNVVIPPEAGKYRITSIGREAFRYRRLIVSVSISDGITAIGNWAFSGCMNLKEIQIPNSVRQIGICAFKGCSKLTSVTISEGVTCIGYMAFYGCPHLTIHAPAGSYAEQYAKENNIPFAAE